MKLVDNLLPGYTHPHQLFGSVADLLLPCCCSVDVLLLLVLSLTYLFCSPILQSLSTLENDFISYENDLIASLNSSFNSLFFSSDSTIRLSNLPICFFISVLSCSPLSIFFAQKDSFFLILSISVCFFLLAFFLSLGGKFTRLDRIIMEIIRDWFFVLSF